jgi:epoxyqueuosine reductase QueG
VIVFGKEVPVPVYKMLPKEKTREMLRIAEALDNTAIHLAGRLEAEQIPALPVPLYLPLRIAEGKIQGVVRLKQVAAAGGIGSQGLNSVLLSPRFGPRLLLSGVVTGLPVQDSLQTEIIAGRNEDQSCTGCGRCIRVCPGGALGPEGVDAFRCRTVSAWVPMVLVPAVKWMLGRTIVLKCLAPLAPWIARMATIRCSLCVTECPNYSGDEGIKHDNKA